VATSVIRLASNPITVLTRIIYLNQHGENNNNNNNFNQLRRTQKGDSRERSVDPLEGVIHTFAAEPDRIHIAERAQPLANVRLANKQQIQFKIRKQGLTIDSKSKSITAKTNNLIEI
jgi:hypothetical protein